MKRVFLVLSVLVSLSEGQAQTTCPAGDSLVLVQDYLKAADMYQACWQRDTSDAGLRLALANTFFQTGDWAAAKYHYHILEVSGQPEAVSKLATIYESQQNLPKAIRYYRQLEKLFPGNALYPRKLGALYLSGNESGEAKTCYQKALDMNPRDLLALSGLAEMYYSEEKNREADSLVAAGLAIDSNHIGLGYLQARLSYRNKDYVRASETLLSIDGRTALPLYYINLLGYSLIQTDSVDRAIFYLRRTLEKEPKNEYALFYMGLAHEKKKMFEEALYFFREANKAGISENMHLFAQGEARANYHLGKYHSVLKAYSKSLEYKKEADIWYYMANTAETGLKQPNKAIQYYEKFLAANPTDPMKIIDAKERLAVLKEHAFMKKGSKK